MPGNGEKKNVCLLDNCLDVKEHLCIVEFMQG